MFVGNIKLWPDNNFTIIHLDTITSWKSVVEGNQYIVMLDIPTNIQTYIDSGVLTLTYTSNSCSKDTFYQGTAKYTIKLNSSYHSTYGIGNPCKAPSSYDWEYTPPEEELPDSDTIPVSSVGASPVYSRLNTWYDYDIERNVHETQYETFDECATLTLVPYLFGSTLDNTKFSYDFAYWNAWYKEKPIVYKTQKIPYTCVTSLSTTVEDEEGTTPSSTGKVSDIHIHANSLLVGDGSALIDGTVRIFYDNTINNKLRYTKPWTTRGSNMLGRPDKINAPNRDLKLYCKDSTGQNYVSVDYILPSDFSGVTQMNPGALYNFKHIKYIVTPLDQAIEITNEAIGTNTTDTVVIAQGPVTIHAQDHFFGTMYLLHNGAVCKPYYPGVSNWENPVFPGEEYGDGCTMYSIITKSETHGKVYTVPMPTTKIKVPQKIYDAIASIYKSYFTT